MNAQQTSHYLLSTLLLLLLWPVPLQAQSTTEASANDLFFEGLDLRQNGDVEGALARFQLALSRDPALHQARLHVAECFFELQMYEQALVEAQAYLDADFDMAEVNRAHTLIGLCSFELQLVDDPSTVAPPADAAQAQDGPAAAAEETSVDPAVEAGEPVPVPAAAEVPAGPSAMPWAPVVIQSGVAVTHIANTASLTTAGPVLGARFLPVRFLEIGVRARLGFGPYSERGGTIRVPDLGAGAAVSIPVGVVRIHLGAMVPVVFSGYGGETRADVGVTGEVGIRVAAKGTRLVIGGQFEAGYLVRPMVAGGFSVGVQIGPMR